MVSRIILTALLGALLAACAVRPERDAQVTTAEPAGSGRTPAAVARPTAEPGARQASDSLLADARAARADNAFDRAESLLQRAQRIDPGNAAVYIELAELYAERGQLEASQSVAERGLLYCEGRDCASLRRLAQR